MKPVSVRFKCFGPYVDEQFIDFKDLQKSGLFLICGETGAGKTTILDAMCYALYGKSSGGFRGELADMRCKRSAPGEDTFVEYIFSSGENTYRFYRCIKPRKQRKTSQEAGKAQTFNEEFECQILRDDQFVPMSDTKATQTYINNQAAEILGLKYEQFKQVIILPQGQFEKLLTSDSDEKEKILVKLFHADKYEKMSKYIVEKLSEEEKALKLQKALMLQKLQSLGCVDLQELQSLTEKTEQEYDALTEQYHLLEEKIKNKKAALEQAKKDDEGFCALETAEKRLADLTAQKSQIQADEKKLRNARAAETATPTYGEYQRCIKDSRNAEKKKQEREKMLLAAQERVGNLNREKQSHEENRSSYEGQKKQKILLENLQDLYQSLDGKEKACRDAGTAEQKAQKTLEKAVSNLTDADQALQDALRKQKNAEDAYHLGQNNYLANIGFILAKDLKEGDKCPVCGSCHHPDPAKAREEHISEKELETLNKENQKALKELDKETKAREKANKEKQLAEVDLASCQKDLDAAKKIYQDALLQRTDGIETEKQRVDTLKILTKTIEDFEDADRSMQDRINAADSDLHTQKARRDEAVLDAEAAEKALQSAESVWMAAAAEAGFADVQAYQMACMEPADRQTLQVRLIQYDTDLQNAQKDMQQKKDALGDRVRPDVAGANAALIDVENQKETVITQQGIQKQALKNQSQIYEELQKELPLWDQKDQRNKANMEFAKRLRGDNSISLQRYVLGVMLTSITGAANRLLKTVYGGRYQLYRTNDSSGSTRKKGLELVVADQDGQRSVNSLSGGEKFLLSLSLGIGLATVVQAQGSGIRLEAMFIDEGFGSLDEKSIDDAMEILETVRSGSGIVGIISHVERLSETIPAKIEITKTKNGSQCRVCC